MDEKGRVAVPAGYAKQIAKFEEHARRLKAKRRAEKEEESGSDSQESANNKASARESAGEGEGAASEPSVFLTINDDRSLRIYPPSAWSRYVASLHKRVEDNPDDLELEDFYHATIGAGAQAVLDRQNRIRIPDYLLTMMNARKKAKVTFLGISNYMLLFDEQDSMDFIRSAVSRFRRSRSERAAAPPPPSRED